MSLTRRVSGVLLVVVLFGSWGWAQSVPERQVEKNRKKLEKIFDAGDHARLQLTDGRRLRGEIPEMRAETFLLKVEPDRTEELRYDEVKKVGRFGPSSVGRELNRLGWFGARLGLVRLIFLR
jgi:hypothetical protein